MAAVYPTAGANFDPGTAQPLPIRPGAMAAQPLRPKGQVTAGRPLPPRAGEAPVAAAAAPVVASADTAAATQQTVVSDGPVVAPAPAPSTPTLAAAAPSAGSATQQRPAKPDARPMRLAFGAGAVAAVSALTIGMVKPDFGGASADEASTSSTSDDAAIEAPLNDRVRVRHVTDYVLLKPGEKPPRGATVISAEDLLGASDPGAGRGEGGAGDQRASRNRDATGGQRADRASAPAREPAQEAKPQPQPKPQPDPPHVETRQSGG